MYFVYILSSPIHNKFYIGSSARPDQRLLSHNAGRGGWTKRCRPWVRMLIEEHSNRETAEKKERYLKSGWGRRWIKKHLGAEIEELRRTGLAT